MKPFLPIITLIGISLSIFHAQADDVAAPAGTATPAPAASAAPAENTAAATQRDTRMAGWREARFGMFIHWGLYSLPAGTWNGSQIQGNGEWIMNRAKIPVADYMALAGKFNPVKFNADDWVSVAKAAGMKYIIITAKHHDGFAMFKSEASRFNIADATPFKRDPLKELAAACQKQGIKFGFYYSQDQDWTAPGGVAIGGHWDKAQDGDFARYIRTKALPQVKELLTNYQPAPAVIWFDTPTKEMTPELAAQFTALLAEHPDVIWNNRLGGGIQGDYETPEQKVPAHGFPGRDWETCMTINDTWGYKTFDFNFKTPEKLIRDLVDVVSKGGNYLLNVGPTAEGLIPDPEIDRLKKMGAWLQVNGEAIYGCGAMPEGLALADPTPTPPDPKTSPALSRKWDWRCTSKPGRIYLHFFNWPAGSFRLAGVKQKVTAAWLLADPKKDPLTVSQTDTVFTLSLPAKAPDPVDSVVCLETE